MRTWLHVAHRSLGLPRWLSGKVQETQETKFQSLHWEEPLEEEMATLYSLLAWKISWTEESGGLCFIVLQRVQHSWAIEHHESLNKSSQWIPNPVFQGGCKTNCNKKKKYIYSHCEYLTLFRTFIDMVETWVTISWLTADPFRKILLIGTAT